MCHLLFIINTDSKHFIIIYFNTLHLLEMAQAPVTVIVQAPAEKARPDMFCAESMVEVSETMGMMIFILNVIDVNLGTTLGSCCNRKGCNWSTYGLSMLHGILAPVCCVGWIMAMMWGKTVWDFNKGNQ